MEFRRVLFRSTEYIDITVAIHPGMTVWPGAPSPRFEQRLDMEHEADVNDSDVFFNLHSGTHVDAPSHFVRGGRTADDLSLNTLIGKAYRSEEHTSELQSLMRISYAVFCLKKKKYNRA